MSVQGLKNSNFSLGNIGSLTNRTSASTSGGSFDLGNGSGGVNPGAAEGNIGLGDVNAKDPNVENALNSVAAENTIQQQFKNQLSLINLQERIQSQSRTTEILTNILKSRHDTSLDAIRNLK